MDESEDALEYTTKSTEIEISQEDNEERLGSPLANAVAKTPWRTPKSHGGIDTRLEICVHGVEISPSKEDVVTGGVQNAVVRLSRGLEERRIRSLLVTNDRKYRETGRKAVDFSLDSMETYLISMRSRYGTSRYAIDYVVKIAGKIAEIHRKTHIDIIHGHSGQIALSIATWFSGKRTGVPTVHTLYCPPRETIANKFYARFLRDAGRVVTISNNTRTALNRIGVPDDRIEVVPPVIDFSRFKPGIGGGERRTLGLDSDEFVILFLGNLTRTKGIDTTLDALSLVRDRHPSVKLLSGIELTHTGTPSRVSEYERRINTLGLANNILEMGLIEDVERVMDAADLVVAPFLDTYSVADYPLTLLDSMAVGTPVVTTDVGGISEFIRDGQNGILVPPDNPVALSEAIIDLIENTGKRKELGVEAAKHVREEFREDEIVEAMRRIYEQVTGIR